YLAVAHRNSPNITIYKRSGNTFTKLSNPSLLPPDSATSCAFDPTGTYLAVGYSNFSHFALYRRNGDTFTRSTLPTSNPRGFAFDPTGTYLAVAHSDSPYITIYRRDEGFTKLSNPSTLPA